MFEEDPREFEGSLGASGGVMCEGTLVDPRGSLGASGGLQRGLKATG